jgi:thiamine transport system substrate-binding protein
MKDLILSTFKRMITLALLAGCSVTPAGQPAALAPTQPAASPAPAQPETAPAATLTVMTHDSFAASEGVVAEFEKTNHVRLVFVKSGDAGTALNKAILSKHSPLADVLYGVDNTFLSRALDAGLFEPYASPQLNGVADEFKLDPQNRVSPVDYGDVCINYDKAWFAKKGLALPKTLRDLAKPEYKGLLVVENPAVASTGLAFMLATVKEFGKDQYLGYWKDLRANGLVVVNDWETAYYTNFSGSSGKGGQPLVVSYATSPVAEVIYANPPVSDAPTGAILGPNTCFRQVEFVGILKGTQNQALAQKFVDFMLSVPFQEDMPLQMFVFPVNKGAKLPAEYQQYTPLPESPASLDSAEIGANREAWIADWQQAVLH